MIDAKITIDASAAQRALSKLDDPAVKRDMAEAVADENVLPALSQANYPPPSGKPMQFVSDKQRRGFFAKLRSGQIQVPYGRTGRTGASYTKQVIADGVAVTSGLASAEYTRGPGQAAYHRDTWQTHEEIAQSLEGEAAQTALQVLLDAVENA